MFRVRRRVVLLAVTVLVTTAAGGLANSAEAKPQDPVSPPASPPQASAAASAGSLVASRPAQLQAGPDDGFVQQPGVSSAGWQYVPYERKYRGLPVIGGDFVVVVDPSGQVRSTSVAQRVPIRDLDVQPRLGRAAAERIAASQLNVASKVEGSRLVVDATGTTPRLAWESTVAGRGPDGPRVQTVEVDAGTGNVLKTKENVDYDIGHSGLNTPVVDVPSVPINIVNSSSGPTIWILGLPAGGLSCEPSDVRRVDPEPLEWGNGDPTNRETACVDAVFATSTEMDMLSSWLGRHGLDGDGHGFPISLEPDMENNAGYVEGDFFNESEVLLGRTNGVWWAPLDIVAHENAHGIDQHTPGGRSGNGTEEFIADAFGTATEWYAREPAPYDTPDFVVGENPAIQGPKRHMYNPSLEVGLNCYSSSDVSRVEIHQAAGVGNHWFYLLAEGSNPSDGQPASPTCNGARISGVGIQRTMQILYNAMLMKTSASSYPNYRLWTLRAANNLFPGDCATLRAVQAAWDAVSVPIQPGEPSACVPNVVGASQAAATAAITAAGLVVGTISQQGSQAPVGTVLAQTPVGGWVVTEGSTVNLTISVFVVTVPDVVGRLKVDAVRILNSVGLEASVTSSKQCISPQAVLRQSPAAGISAINGTTVNLVVDSGTIRTCDFP